MPNLDVLNVARYPTYQVFLVVVVALVAAGLLFPLWIRLVRFRNIGQQVRADGPQGHLVKQGTPTMGGVLILLVVTGVYLLMGRIGKYGIITLLAMVACGILGSTDAYAKVLRERSPGLRPRAKLLWQSLIAVAFGLLATCAITGRYPAWLGSSIWPYLARPDMRIVLASDVFRAGSRTNTLTVTFPAEATLVAGREDLAPFIRTLPGPDWFAFAPTNEPGDSVIGMERWLDKPAGAHGGVRMVGDHFEKDVLAANAEEDAPAITVDTLDGYLHALLAGPADAHERRLGAHAGRVEARAVRVDLPGERGVAAETGLLGVAGGAAFQALARGLPVLQQPERLPILGLPVLADTPADLAQNPTAQASDTNGR